MRNEKREKEKTSRLGNENLDVWLVIASEKYWFEWSWVDTANENNILKEKASNIDDGASLEEPGGTRRVTGQAEGGHAWASVECAAANLKSSVSKVQ